MSKNKTPIIIILYNRPNHTQKLFQSITSGKNFSKYEFYVFCDGPRNKEDVKKIKKIKTLINQFKKKTRVKSCFRKKNIGLIKNITNSINLILKKNDKAIILEDDLILNYDFFNFMEKALTKYGNHKKIFQVSGYSYPIKNNNDLHYFLALTSCWGWGITAQNWQNFNKFLNDKKLINFNYQKLRNSKLLRHSFNYFGSYNYFSMLEKSLNNKVNSWGIIFYLYLFINKKLTLFPNQSLVKNDGFDGSGNHKSKNNSFNKEFNLRSYGNFPKKVISYNYSKDRVINYFKKNLSLYGKIKNKLYENFFKKIIPPILIDVYRDIYIKNLIRKNKKFVSQDEQDTKIYDTDLTAEKLSEWGKGSTWNEIQMFFISKKGNILDVACGTGQNMSDVQKLSPDANIYGCDISQNLIDICIKSGIDNKKLICSDATKIDYPENFFDFSYSIGSLEHFTEKGLVDVIEKLHFITKEYSIHMMPVSKKNENEGWIKTYQTFHNNSVEWWVEKFEKKFSLVQVVDSSWSDHISIGKWFICYK